MRPAPRALAAAAVAGLLARQALAHPPQRGDWQTTNYHGRPVTRWGGVALAQGAAGGALALALSRQTPAAERRVLAATALAAISAGALGAVDDLTGSTASKGLGGHLTALRRGEVTTGTVKVAGLGLTGLAAAGLARTGSADGWRKTGSAGAGPAGTGPARVTGLLIDAALVAGAANLANLLDLRPGRAAKAGLAVAGMLPGTAPVVVAGATLAVLPDDLGERVMLGDCGANALGAALAAGSLGHGTRRTRLLALAGVTALTLASERVSYSQVIDRTPWLDRWDRWGRLPEPPAEGSLTDEPSTDGAPTDKPPTDKPPTDKPPTDKPLTDEPGGDELTG